MPAFAFAFGNALFSDRLLQFQVSPSFADNQVNTDEEPNSGRTELHVSSVLLAAHSEYFKRLFFNGMSESGSEVVVIHVTGAEEERGLRNLIEYMYTGRLKEPSDAESTIMLLCVADRFAISSCMEALVEILKQFPNTVRDCLLVLGLPETLKSNISVQPVVEQCRSYLCEQFADVAGKQSEFLSLNLEGVKVVLDSESLIVQYEEEVFQYLLDWLESNCESLESRICGCAAEEIAEVVRYPWMTGEFLEDVVAKSPVMQSPACQALLMEALKFKSLTHVGQQQMMWEKKSHNRFRPRNRLILENFWGNSSKTYVLQQTDTSCQVYFDIPQLELVICKGDNFQSRSFSLGPNKYTFYMDAESVRTSSYMYNPSYRSYASSYSGLTFRISLMFSPIASSTWKASHMLEYSIAMKRDYSDNYENKSTAQCDLQSAKAGAACAQFNDLFSRRSIDSGYSFPRWDSSISGPVFFRLDLQLKERPT